MEKVYEGKSFAETVSPQRQFVRGMRDEVPILIGIVPFGLIYGVLALAAGLDTASAQAMSAVVFAGSAQFMVIQLVGTGVPLVVLVLTGFVINLRHLLYSASISPHLRHLSPWWKTILSYLLTDEAYAVVINQYQSDTQPPNHQWYFLGAGLSMWATWQISTALGIFLGAQVPEGWGLTFSLPLMFIALSVPAIKDRPALVAAIVAGVVAVLAYPLPYKLGLILAGLAGILAGLWSERQ